MVRESINFQRGLSSREIKDRLVGFRPGQLITYDEPWAKNKPYKEVYMFIKRAREDDLEGDGIPIAVCYIGALFRKDGKLNHFLVRSAKVFGITDLWAEGKRGLTNEEIDKVRKALSELPKYLEKIAEETGLVPSLNEAMEFKRSSSEREIKEKLFGWRPGQILVINDNDNFHRILAFKGITDKPLLIGNDVRVIRCLEIGQVAGHPKIAYFHLGIVTDTVLKEKDQLKIPSEEEIIAIQKSLKNPNYQKYIERAEEKIGAKLFV